jgi:hypothetical protein
MNGIYGHVIHLVLVSLHCPHCELHSSIFNDITLTLFHFFIIVFSRSTTVANQCWVKVITVVTDYAIRFIIFAWITGWVARLAGFCLCLVVVTNLADALISDWLEEKFHGGVASLAGCVLPTGQAFRGTGWLQHFIYRCMWMAWARRSNLHCRDTGNRQSGP